MRQLERTTEAVIFLLGAGGLRITTSPRLGPCPDPVLLQWHQVPIGLKNQFTELNINQAITLVKNHFGVDKSILLFLPSPKTESKSKFSKPFTIARTSKVNKLACRIWAKSDTNFAV